MTDELTDEHTCGRGLAAHAALPAMLAELTACTAGVLETHMPTLDVTDEHAKRELATYQRLAAAHREITTSLRATAEDMAGCRDLPMGRHDPAALSSPEIPASFERFVEAERELLALLQSRVEQDGAMLAAMRGAGRG